MRAANDDAMPWRDLREGASLWDDSFVMFKLQSSIGWRMVTAVVWAGVAMSGWYWTQVGLAVGGPVLVDTPSAVKTPEISSPLELARLLGATAPVAAGPGPGPKDRFILSGVIASGVGQGAALIAVDGKPARPFAVGSELAPGYVLVSVAPREAMLAEGLFAPVRAVLSLPMPRQAESSAVPPVIAPAIPVPPGSPTATQLAPAGVSGVAPSVAQGSFAQVPLSVPARADARRQLQTTLRRDDRRTN